MGITANTVMFSAYRAIVDPRAFAGTENLVLVYESGNESRLRAFSARAYIALEREQRSLSAIASHRSKSFSISDRVAGSGIIDTLIVSPGFFQVLKSQPILGRPFEPAEYLRGGRKAVVVSHKLWQSRLGASTDVIGQSLRLDGDAYAIVGVMPGGFQLPAQVDAWLPDTSLAESGQEPILEVIGRLSPGVSTQAAQAELSDVVARVTGSSERSVSVLSFSERLAGVGARTSAGLMLLAASLLLLVVCLNVASIQSADFLQRQRETATALALGASRAEVIRSFLAESVAVAVAGGALGAIGATWTVRWIMARFEGEMPQWIEIRIDWEALLYTLAVSVLVGIVAGLLPALQCSRAPWRALQEGQGGSRKTALLMRGVVLGQVLAAVLLLVGSETAIAGLRSTRNRDLGFAMEGKQAISIPLTPERYASLEPRLEAVRQLVASVGSIPGVNRLAAVNPLPIKDRFSSAGIALPGAGTETSSAEPHRAASYRCTRQYFSVMEIPVLAGEPFSRSGDPTPRNEVILSASLARELWSSDHADAVGRSVEIADQLYEVVGVVADTHHSPNSVSGNAVFRQMESAPTRRLSLVFGSDLPPGSLQRSIRRVSPTRPGARKREPAACTISRHIHVSDQATTFSLSILAALALVLTLMGVYGMTSSMVVSRTKELAIRRILGCSNAEVARLVLEKVAGLGVIGVVAGAILSYPLVALIRHAVYGVGDLPVSSVVFVGLAVLATLLAGSFPVWRVRPDRAVRNTVRIVLNKRHELLCQAAKAHGGRFLENQHPGELHRRRRFSPPSASRQRQYVGIDICRVRIRGRGALVLVTLNRDLSAHHGARAGCDRRGEHRSIHNAGVELTVLAQRVDGRRKLGKERTVKPTAGNGGWQRGWVDGSHDRLHPGLDHLLGKVGGVLSPDRKERYKPCSAEPVLPVAANVFEEQIAEGKARRGQVLGKPPHSVQKPLHGGFIWPLGRIRYRNFVQR